MSKVRTISVDPKERYRAVGDFFEVISGLKSKKEIIDFFIGLLTPSESLMLARRIQIAKMIIEEKSYVEIMKKLKVGCHNVAKTERWLHEKGEEYNEWITKRLKSTIKEKQSKSLDYSYSILDKYPSHRLWKKLLSD